MSLPVPVPESSKQKHSRYPEYKDSGIEWLGEIPEHWETKTIKRLFKVYNGSTPKSSEPIYWDGAIPWVTPEDLGELSSNEIDNTKRNITEAGYSSCGTTMVPVGSLVLSTRAPIGHLAIAQVDLCTNQGCRSLVPYGNISHNFGFYVLYSARQELVSFGQGSTFMELGKSKLEAVSLALPSIEEQQAIADYLDAETAHIDQLVEKKKRLIALLEEQRTAMITQAVTKGLNPDVEIKDSGVEWLGEIPEHWDVTKLKYACSKSAIYGANATNDSYSNTGLRFLRTSDIDDRGNLLEDSAIYIDPTLVADYILNNGDILLSRSGTLGRSFVYDSNIHGACSYAGYLVRFVPNNKLIPKFAFYFTKSRVFSDWLQTSAIQSTIGNINGQKYANMPIPISPIQEQQTIADYLDKETARIDNLINKINQAIEKLQEYRSALITAAVTGKIDVRQHVS
jgi:type I restriction enzyme S subunit